ncbi:hypothetical protein OIU76_016541 [Salix suchowensis]|nr:hypothetical protein OIU76_016541 [Salix suchowensis]
MAANGYIFLTGISFHVNSPALTFQFPPCCTDIPSVRMDFVGCILVNNVYFESTNVRIGFDGIYFG